MSGKKDNLLSILTLSEKRKDILFLLQDGPKSLSDIKDHFDVLTQEISPRLKEMEASNLITKREGSYELTAFGRISAMYYRPFLDTLESIDANRDFWKMHDVSPIPDGMLNRIQELKDCRTTRYINGHNYGSHLGFEEAVLSSDEFYGVTSIYLPSWIDMFLKLANMGIQISIIVTKGVFEIIKNKHEDALIEGLQNENAKFFVLGTDENITFAITDKFLSLSLFFKDGNYDPQNDLEGSDKAALSWGIDLYNHYQNKAQELEIKKVIPQAGGLTQKLIQRQSVVIAQ